MGMPRDEYWNGDPSAVKDYRKAKEIKNKQRNYELWLQGMYIYEALCDVSPLFRTFSKGKAHPYPLQPYALNEKDKEDLEELKAKREMEKMKAEMEAWMNKINNMQQGGEKVGSRD